MAELHGNQTQLSSLQRHLGFPDSTKTLLLGNVTCTQLLTLQQDEIKPKSKGNTVAPISPSNVKRYFALGPDRACVCSAGS